MPDLCSLTCILESRCMLLYMYSHGYFVSSLGLSEKNRERHGNQYLRPEAVLGLFFVSQNYSYSQQSELLVNLHSHESGRCKQMARSKAGFVYLEEHGVAVICT